MVASGSGIKGVSACCQNSRSASTSVLAHHADQGVTEEGGLTPCPFTLYLGLQSSPFSANLFASFAGSSLLADSLTISVPALFSAMSPSYGYLLYSQFSYYQADVISYWKIRFGNILKQRLSEEEMSLFLWLKREALLRLSATSNSSKASQTQTLPLCFTSTFMITCGCHGSDKHFCISARRIKNLANVSSWHFFLLSHQPNLRLEKVLF